jgi:ech hydrogenase subunit A
MVNLGVYLLLRISPSIVLVPAFSWAVALVGAISFLVTSVLAIGSSSSKKVLAYSTIGNLGLIVMCAAIGSEVAIYAGMLLLLFHAVSKALLFLAVGVVKHETGSEDIESMSGLRQRMPLVTFALLVGVVTILLPPFGAFASKWMISELVSDYVWLAIPLALGFGASVVFYGKWLGRVFAIEPTVKTRSFSDGRPGAPFTVSLWALCIGALGLPFLIPIITEVLIGPFLGTVPNDPLWVTTSFGQIPLLALLALTIIAALSFAAFFKPKAETAASAYSGGEPYRFEVAGAYFLSTSRQSKINDAVNALAIFILALMVLVPLMQEVTTWLT